MAHFDRGLDEDAVVHRVLQTAGEAVEGSFRASEQAGWHAHTLIASTTWLSLPTRVPTTFIFSLPHEHA